MKERTLKYDWENLEWQGYLEDGEICRSFHSQLLEICHQKTWVNDFMAWNMDRVSAGIIKESNHIADLVQSWMF